MAFARWPAVAGPIMKLVFDAGQPVDSLPVAHACFNRIDLPPYSSQAACVEKVRITLEHTRGRANFEIA
jgi:E3 ubiquitin-protein ligase NEDD4